MIPFDHIVLIFNPKSSGDAKAKAIDFRAQLQAVGLKSSLMPTNHAGHASEIAYKVAREYRRPLIISVSGDGGYNEVVNGAMRAKEQSKTAHPIVTVIAAGNANDHKRVMRGDTPLINLVRNAQPLPIDLLHIHATSSKVSLSRYAHSYIGFGLTPEVGHELNRHGKNLLSEIKIVLKTFLRFTPFTVVYDGMRRQADSLVFANINEMAKVVTLDSSNDVRDDKFEVIELPHHGKLRLLFTMIHAALHGFHHPPQYHRYQFELPEAQPVQCDGEIDQLSSNSVITITSRGEAIDSLYVP